MVARHRQATDRPVRWVVNTHWHPYHLTGNAVFRDAFPGARIVGTPATAQRFDDGWKYNDTKPLGAARATFQQRIADGKAGDGSPLPSAMRDFYAAEIREIDNAAREWAGV